MQQKTIYVLHKNGAKSHYIALEHLLNTHHIILKHREFSVFSKLFKGIFSLNFLLIKKQLINLSFLCNLLFSKNKKIVLGIAPFDSKLNRLTKILKNHQVFYHTSWTYWDKTFHPKNKNNTPKIFEQWRQFLEEDVKHIFTVTNQSKQQLLKNYKIPENKINTVYHSLDNSFLKKTKNNRTNNSFIYLGRLVPQKGIEEILSYFSNNPNHTITIVGKGKLEKIVSDFATKYKNITYIGHTNNKSELAELMSKHEYCLLNSIKTKKWEELFGLVIIESMAQGLIPISTNHSGPKEIITEDIGFLFEEQKLNDTLNTITSQEFDIKKSKASKIKAHNFLQEQIAPLWMPILE